ncbi:MAG: ferritin [Phycisphaerae bacterium]
MMISEKMNKQLCEQITNELNASQTYLAMACMFEGKALQLLAKRFRKQAEEEREHALKIVDYILEVGGSVELQPLPAPRAEYPTVLAAIEAAVEHEQTVTKQIHELCTLAESEKDHGTRNLLNWYVEEQIEEVSSMRQLADVARMCGNALLQLEAYLIHRASK